MSEQPMEPDGSREPAGSREPDGSRNSALLHVDSEQLGALQIPADGVLEFPGGIPGFPEATRFCLVDVKPGSRFQLLQSCQRANLAFVVTNPQYSHPDFSLERARELATPPLDADEGFGLACIVTVPPPPGKLTINLAAPLVIGTRSRRGVQVLMQRSGYTLRHEL